MRARSSLECPGSSSCASWRSPEPGPGEALVRIRRVGVCGTDLHAFRGRQPFLSYPRILGHELRSRCSRWAPDDRVRPGRPVAVRPSGAARATRAARA